jgi:hypothetical protein
VFLLWPFPQPIGFSPPRVPSPFFLGFLLFMIQVFFLYNWLFYLWFCNILLPIETQNFLRWRFVLFFHVQVLPVALPLLYILAMDWQRWDSNLRPYLSCFFARVPLSYKLIGMISCFVYKGLLIFFPTNKVGSLWMLIGTKFNGYSRKHKIIFFGE